MAKTHEEDVSRSSEWQRVRSATGRNVSIPAIKNPARRERCRHSLRLFCETYNPAAFGFAWSEDHLRVIARLEEAARQGVLLAFAMPRGHGKTVLCRMTAFWALSYAMARYVFIIGANAGRAEESLNAIKTFMRFRPEWCQDFPEIAAPIQALKGIAHRAPGQTWGKNQEPTLIVWGRDHIVLPTVGKPKGWKKCWTLREDGMVPTSGAVCSAAGLTSDGIRGSLVTLSTGEQVRPDLVLLDDPQTPESARSATQNETRERLISADVLGMAGPGKSISAVMPCTVITPGDMVDRILDRKKHPLWRGERTRLMYSMPTNTEAWENYREVWERCVGKEPPDLTEAHNYYLAHRDILDEGAQPAWEERKLPEEISAIQHAMHLYFRCPITFMAEYQNDPLPLIEEELNALTRDEVMEKTNRHSRRVAPTGTIRLTAMIDVQQDLLYYVVCAFEDDFTSHVVDYGTYPGQGRNYFSLRDANPTLAGATGIHSLEGSLHCGLETLCAKLCGGRWEIDQAGEVPLEKVLIDANWGVSTELVYRFCRSSPFSAILTPSHGAGITASGLPIDDWPRKPGERRGLHWIMPIPKPGRVRHVKYDTNFWKSFLVARLKQPQGERGAMDLFGNTPSQHRLFADHLLAEYRVPTEGRNRKVEEWKLRPHKPDNHYLDCLTGCLVAASMQGCALAGMPASSRGPRKRVSYQQMQQEARARR